MKPGDYILDLIGNTPRKCRTIALIRHTKRESFIGVPEKCRDEVGITDEGIIMAKDFGRSISQIIPPYKNLFLGHTVVKRAEMTARLICDGYLCQNHGTILGPEPEIVSPIINDKKRISARNRLGWPVLIEKWLEGELEPGIFRNPDAYTDEILRKLLHYPDINPGELLIFVAHDTYLFPILFSLFGENVKKIEVLNGIVISEDANTARIEFCDSNHSFKTERRIL